MQYGRPTLHPIAGWRRRKRFLLEAHRCFDCGDGYRGASENHPVKSIDGRLPLADQM
jgi:hypothetical protein